MIKVLIIGAGVAGKILINQLKDKNDYQILGIVDDFSKEKNIENIPIVGKTKDVDKLIIKNNIDEIIIAIPSANQETINQIINKIKTNIQIKIIPGIYEIIQNKYFEIKQIRQIQANDLLGREEIGLDINDINSYYRGKTILVTGGGGSIGSEIIEQILKLEVKKVIALGHGENSIFDLTQKYINDPRFEYIIGDTKDQKKIEYEFKKNKPDIIFHAAAHKHVFLMEKYPDEAIKNNIIGTYTCAIAAIKANVKQFILISTDKVVEPKSIMGLTKKHCEKIVQSLNQIQKETLFSIVRFGNVLGSRGSVVPLFQQQINNGGPLTLTNPNATRYFMSIKEASILVIKSAVLNSNNIFMLNMGKPLKILDLAKKMIKLSGKNTSQIEIKTIGLKPGEKVTEKLSENNELAQKTRFDKLYKLESKPNKLFKSYQELEEYINKAKIITDQFENTKIISFLKDTNQ